MSEVVTSRTNARVKQLRAAFNGQARLSSGMVAIEGEHLLEEAVRSGQVLKTVFVSERREVPASVPRGVEVVRLAGDVLQSCVETQTPQGVAALLVPPVSSVADMLGGASPLILVAVGLQDPGNLGTLIRSAEAFGADGVLTTPGTVSAWNQKAIRASAGSIFRVPVAFATPEAMERLKQAGVRLLAALKDDARSISDEALGATLCGPCAVLVGNEGAGLGEDWVRVADKRVTIPCPGRVESLNAAVAGSILLWEIAQRRRATATAS